jgi:hypothetical protein
VRVAIEPADRKDDVKLSGALTSSLRKIRPSMSSMMEKTMPWCFPA